MEGKVLRANGMWARASRPCGRAQLAPEFAKSTLKTAELSADYGRRPGRPRPGGGAALA